MTFRSPAPCQDNTPARIASALAPAREQELRRFRSAPISPPSKQRLIPALRLLAAASPLRLVRLAVRGLSEERSSEVERLPRYGWVSTRPTPTERFHAALLRGALAASRIPSTRVSTPRAR